MITNSPAACGGICGGARCSRLRALSMPRGTNAGDKCLFPCIQRAKHHSNTILTQSCLGGRVDGHAVLHQHARAQHGQQLEEQVGLRGRWARSG